MFTIQIVKEQFVLPLKERPCFCCFRNITEVAPFFVKQYLFTQYTFLVSMDFPEMVLSA